MTIGEVAKRAGLRTSAIRYYESAGVLPTAVRVSGQRRYDSSVLRTLDIIKLAQEAGFTLAEIRTLFGNFTDETSRSAAWVELATRKLGEVNAQIEHAHRMKALLEEGLACACTGLDDCKIVDRNSVNDPSSRGS